MERWKRSIPTILGTFGVGYIDLQRDHPTLQQDLPARDRSPRLRRGHDPRRGEFFDEIEELILEQG